MPYGSTHPLVSCLCCLQSLNLMGVPFFQKQRIIKNKKTKKGLGNNQNDIIFELKLTQFLNIEQHFFNVSWMKNITACLNKQCA